MSAHGHDDHGSHDSHGAHDAHADHGHGHDDHGHGGHDDHGHGGHGERWGDYNTQTPPPSTLPPVPRYGLAIMGGVLALLMYAIVCVSLALADAGRGESHAKSHDTHGSHTESHDTHGGHADKKAEH